MYKKISSKIRPGVIFATSLVLIFIARFGLEFVKTKQATYASESWLSTGQMLSIPFILVGTLFIVFSLFKKQTNV